MSAYVGSSLKSDIEQRSETLRVNPFAAASSGTKKNSRQNKRQKHGEQRDEALVRAFKAVGGQSALGLLLDRKKQAVWHWLRVPPKFVLRVEELTGIPRSELRPDLYPPGETLAFARTKAVSSTVSRAA